MTNKTHIIPTFEDALLNPLDYEVKVGWLCTLTHVDDDTIGTFITHAQGSQIIQAMSEKMAQEHQRLAYEDRRMDKLNDLAAEQIREEHGPNCPDYDQLVEERFMRLSTE
jgi:hypothetical protein